MSNYKPKNKLNIKIVEEIEEKERFLFNIESDMKNLLISQKQNKQERFNNLIIELKPFFSGFEFAYFINLVKEKRNNKIKSNDITKTYILLNECKFLRRQIQGLEVVFKPTETEINLIQNKVYRWIK